MPKQQTRSHSAVVQVPSKGYKSAANTILTRKIRQSNQFKVDMRYKC